MKEEVFRIGQISAEQIAKTFGAPVYVLNLDIVHERIARLRTAFPPERADLYYSIKANANPHLLNVIGDCGLGVDACSIGDLWIAKKCGFPPERISFTGVALDTELLNELRTEGVTTNLDSLSELKRWMAEPSSRPVGLRVAPDVRAGFSEHCRGGEWGGKMGIDLAEVPKAIRLAKGGGTIISGIHIHIGSGMLEPEPILEAVKRVLPLFTEFSQLRYLNIGGGLGTSYHDDEDEFPIEILAKRLMQLVGDCERLRGEPIRLKLEPGEFIGAPAGWLLARVVVKKTWQRNRDKREVIILNASMNHFPGGVLYGSQNRIFLCRNPHGEKDHTCLVCGNTNQSGDQFGGIRHLPEINEGDLLALGSCGAYAASRASTFNEHPLAPEVVCSGGRVGLSVRKQTLEELFGRTVSEPVWTELASCPES